MFHRWVMLLLHAYSISGEHTKPAAAFPTWPALSLPRIVSPIWLALLAQADGVIVQDDPANQLYPLATESEDKKETFVGRIRKDPDVANGFHLWIVSDNLIKGAAWNSLQIAETMVKMKLI